jgi:ATP-dependent Lhr-like helicase
MADTLIDVKAGRLWVPDADSRVYAWFAEKYGEPTPAQLEAWPRIAAGRNVLIASPTGTGKTFAAFLGVLDALEREHRMGTMRETIHCVYVSPLRALGYDLEKNLQEPLRELFGKSPPIRVELRSGDTGQSQRARQLLKPPHLLLTTPESLCVLLSQDKWLARLADVRWVIVDEIHALAGNKRGAHLALSIERLARWRESNGGAPVRRIGLSATVAPLSEVGRFLSGTEGDCDVVDVSAKKRVDLSVYTPLRKNPYPEAGFTGERLVKELGQLISKHQTTLVFCNTRSGAEATSFWLRENFPKIASQIECHHASLERDVRRNVEDRLKRGELRAVICSTSLELGIDIGSVELVVMLATPKGVSRALQRAGRAGHNIHSVSRGILMATNVSDLVEACATARLANRRHLDEVKIPHAPLDVLAQHLVSMGCTRSWSHDEAFALVREAYPYRELQREEFDAVLDYLAGGGKSLRQQYTEVFGKIVLDEEAFETRDGRVKREFLQNVGVIPTVGSVRVRVKTRALGSVEESFIRMLKIGDVFIMAGRPVRLEKLTQMDAWVAPADGEVPTVPRWNAAKMPLSNRVCQEIIAFRSELKAEVATCSSRDDRDDCLREWISERLDCGKANAAVIWQMYSAQNTISEIPTADFLLVEEYIEQERDHLPEAADLERASRKRRGRKAPPKQPQSLARHYFFHSLIGRAANDALSRVVSQRLSRLRGGNAIATPHDYGFVLTVTPQQHFTAADLPVLLAAPGFDDDLQQSLQQSEMLKYHFRNAAQTGLMVYRNYFDEQKSVRKLAWSTEVIFNVLQRHEPDHVLLREAERELRHTYVDADGAREFLHAQSARPVHLITVDRVPPLSFAMYATKIKEALLVEDPFETMERLYNLWWKNLETEPTAPTRES